MLTVVIIGRNEAEHLERLADSIDALREAVAFPIESLYVDSASSDGSLDIARRRFDRQYEMDESPHLCASSGRYIGVLEASHPWVLHVDGDMELCPDFFPVISDVVGGERDCVGVVGIYVHRFDNNTSSVQGFRLEHGGDGPADHFGGCVLLRRSAIIAAGNWDPAIYGNEELELYTRLGSGQKVVDYVEIPMINHFDEYRSRFGLMKRLLYPGGGLGKVFYGFGQCLRATWTKRRLTALMRLVPQPFVVWAGFFLLWLFSLLLPWQAVASIMFIFLAVLAVAYRVGPLFKHVVSVLPGFLGGFRYHPEFRPKVDNFLD